MAPAVGWMLHSGGGAKGYTAASVAGLMLQPATDDIDWTCCCSDFMYWIVWSSVVAWLHCMVGTGRYLIFWKSLTNPGSMDSQCWEIQNSNFYVLEILKTNTLIYVPVKF